MTTKQTPTPTPNGVEVDSLLSDKVIDEIMSRSGFDSIWENVEADTEMEIREAVEELALETIKTRTDKCREEEREKVCKYIEYEMSFDKAAGKKEQFRAGAYHALEKCLAYIRTLTKQQP